MSYKSPLLAWGSLYKLRCFLESGSHESHVGCGLEGDPIPRQRGGQKGPEPDEDPAGPQSCLQVVAGAQVVHVLAPSPLPRGLAPEQQHPVEEQSGPAQQRARHARVSHEGQGELCQRHSACRGRAERVREQQQAQPSQSLAPALLPSPPPPWSRARSSAQRPAESLLPGQLVLANGNTLVNWAHTAPCPRHNLHSCTTPL